MDYENKAPIALNWQNAWDSSCVNQVNAQGTDIPRYCATLMEVTSLYRENYFAKKLHYPLSKVKLHVSLFHGCKLRWQKNYTFDYIPHDDFIPPDFGVIRQNHLRTIGHIIHKLVQLIVIILQPWAVYFPVGVRVFFYLFIFMDHAVDT